jgi:uncharacterized membrane protein
VDAKPTIIPGLPGPPGPQTNVAPTALRSAWLSIRGRILGGLLLVLPVLVTFWVVYWLYTVLENYAIDPLTRLVLWKVRQGQPDADLPPWFENYAAPLIGVLVALLLLYGLGFFVNYRLRRVFDALMLRMPGLSVVYNGVRRLFQTLDRQRGQQRPQRVALVPFPHPGMKTPGFVTSSCRAIETGKVILCVYVPTTPVPTSGYFLMIPEEDVVELNWSSEQTLQTIISGGLTAPRKSVISSPGPPQGPIRRPRPSRTTLRPVSERTADHPRTESEKSDERLQTNPGGPGPPARRGGAAPQPGLRRRRLGREAVTAKATYIAERVNAGLDLAEQ